MSEEKDPKEILDELSELISETLKTEGLDGVLVDIIKQIETE